jgi:hypothetical protein
MACQLTQHSRARLERPRPSVAKSGDELDQDGATGGPASPSPAALRRSSCGGSGNELNELNERSPYFVYFVPPRRPQILRSRAPGLRRWSWPTVAARSRAIRSGLSTMIVQTPLRRYGPSRDVRLGTLLGRRGRFIACRAMHPSMAPSLMGTYLVVFAMLACGKWKVDRCHRDSRDGNPIRTCWLIRRARDTVHGYQLSQQGTKPR